MPPSSRQQPALSFWQIWNMCFGFIGIQFGFALQNANVSRIFQTLGANIEAIPILWIAAPVTGLVVQPIIGYLSDNTWNRLGRRRPYFTLGALLASAALVFMPHSPSLWIAAGMLWVLDASINIAMEPFRAFVGDMLPQRQRTLGFAMQGFFIGIASVVASALPWIMTNWWGISNKAAAGVVPDSVIFAFYLGAAIFLLSVLWTVITTPEYTPEQLAAFHRAAGLRLGNVSSPLRALGTYIRGGTLCLLLGALLAGGIYGFNLKAELYILAAGIAVFGVLQLLAALLQHGHRTHHGLYQVTHDLFHMPRTMKQLAAVQFFSWFALFAMWIYATSGVAAYHFGATTPASVDYNRGADWVGVLFAAYNGFAALAAFAIPVMARKLGRKLTHAVNLLLGAAGFISILLIRDPQWLLVSMVGVGFAWASILSMPYAILSCALPGHKMGVFMGIFNFFIVIPQILAASILGLIVGGLFNGESIYALALGGLCFAIAAALTLGVEDKQP